MPIPLLPLAGAGLGALVLWRALRPKPALTVQPGESFSFALKSFAQDPVTLASLLSGSYNVQTLTTKQNPNEPGFWTGTGTYTGASTLTLANTGEVVWLSAAKV